MWAHPTLGAVLEDLRQRLGATAVALVGADGAVRGAALPAGVYADTFAIMAATTFGAARTAHAELGRAPPEWLTAYAPDSTTVVIRAGPAEIVVLVVPPDLLPERVREEAGRFLDLLTAPAPAGRPA